MPVRSCKVTIKDMDGVNHTVEVTAVSLYEDVALGFLIIVRSDHEETRRFIFALRLEGQAQRQLTDSGVKSGCDLPKLWRKKRGRAARWVLPLGVIQDVKKFRAEDELHPVVDECCRFFQRHVEVDPVRAMEKVSR